MTLACCWYSCCFIPPRVRLFVLCCLSYRSLTQLERDCIFVSSARRLRQAWGVSDGGSIDRRALQVQPSFPDLITNATLLPDNTTFQCKSPQTTLASLGYGDVGGAASVNLYVQV